MRKYIKRAFVLSTIFVAVCLMNVNAFAGNDKAELYEKEYLSQIYDSENGLEGTTANCICADQEGFLWLGGYTGLYRYDGNVFKKYLLDGRTLPVNDLVQDQQGNLWIGTNGEGIYKFDGEDYTEYRLDEEKQGASVVNEIYLDTKGVVWVGTKAGLFSIDTRETTQKTKSYSKFSDTNIQDIGELSSGEILIVQKTGKLFLLENSTAREIALQKETEGVPRCCYGTEDGTGNFYIGTTEKQILKCSASGEILAVIEENGLSSFNEIYKLKDREFWVCTDTGIGILENDQLTKLDLDFRDSVEEGCQDYQGNFWFVSSRQGILKLYENYFWDLGAYWNIKQTVNSIQPYKDKIYVGCDEGLYCYQGKEQVEDALVKACRNLRIRQIYLDNENNLWVSTYQNGIKRLNASGRVFHYDTKNSGLETSKIRCIWQKQDKELLVGTEEGLYQIDEKKQIKKYTDDAVLNTKRILAVKEACSGKIYAATDGYGIYEIEDEQVKKIYSKKQGLLSNVVMKIVPSEAMDGVWAVTGEGVCFIGDDGNVKKATGISVANSLDLLLTEDGKAVVLAGNGFFELKETDLLKEDVPYLYLNKQDGLPVDFTANARNTIKDGVLYMCGTAGAAGLDLNKEQGDKPIRLYVNSVTEDGENVEMDDGEIIFSSSAHRINIDIEMINFVHRNVYTSYFLEGMDETWTVKKNEGVTDISYTNLAGGKYKYNYHVYDEGTDKCIAEISVAFRKNLKFWEQMRVKILLAILAAVTLMFLLVLVINLREKHVKRQCYIAFLQEKETEISELAYRDVVTGAYNRNYFEKEKGEINLEKLYALVSVSVNHIEYFKSKYGIFATENILRTGVEIMQKYAAEEIKICRVSENIFYFAFTKPVLLENYIQDIKENFKKKGEECQIPYSFSVGAIYNNTVGKENIDELMERCDSMRMLDEKHAEAKFIEGKMKML